MQKEVSGIKGIITGLSLLLLFEQMDCFPNRPDLFYETIDFEDCGSLFDIITLTSTSCTSEPCSMTLNTRVNITAEFITDGTSDYSVLQHDVRWMFKASTDSAIVSPPICQGNNYCTYQSTGGIRSFRAEIDVKSIPAIAGTLYWRVLNKNDKLIICFKLPVKIGVY